MKISITDCRKEVKKNTGGVKLVMMLLLANLMALNPVFSQEGEVNDDTPMAYEMPRTNVIPINNSETKAQDMLYIKLPEGYEENSDMEYPVIYFTHPVQHIEILSATTESLLEDVILVGITFQKGMTFRTVDSYMNFIRNDVFKTVESSYRADADRRTYFGYSSGALVGAYILSIHPNAFQNFILGSPALGGDSTVTQKIYEFGSNTANGRKELNANVFLSYGTSEKEADKELFEEFITILENLNDQTVTFEHIVVEGDHQTSFAMTTVRGVTWLSGLIKDSDFPTLEDRYFGEEPPGLIPKLFAPAIVSPEGLFEGGKHSSDMKEFYFSRKNGQYEKRTFFVIRYENGSWGNESETDIKWPKFSKDGNILYGGKEYRERTDTGWSEPKSQGEFLKDQAHGISLSSKGTYYFGFYKKENKGQGSIRYSRFKDGKREIPVKMGKEINTGIDIAHPHIAPDESYLLWDVEREDGYGGSDIYISFRANDGSWLPAMNMGDKINTALQESSPRVTHDGKYLFFSRGKWEVKEDGSENWVGKPFWVDTQVIENLRPKQ